MTGEKPRCGVGVMSNNRRCCSLTEAGRATGLSRKTIQRRIRDESLPSDYSWADLRAVRREGHRPSGLQPRLDPDDLIDIVDRGLAGESAVSIARDYPVSRRQINRILDGTRSHRYVLAALEQSIP